MLFRIVLLIFLIPLTGVCQVEPYHRDEFQLGINLNTNGGLIGGVSGKWLRHKKDSEHSFISLDLVNVKHNQEKKASNAMTGNMWILDKQNYFFVIRPSFGRDHILFRKAPDEGVQVNGSFAGGISAGVIKPYFIRYDHSGDLTDVRSEPYTPWIHTEESKIIGRGSMLAGIGQSSLVPGLNLRGSLNFQFGNYGKAISGIEVGGVLEGFFRFGNGSFISPAYINIIPSADRSWLYSSLFVSLYYGFKR